MMTAALFIRSHKRVFTPIMMTIIGEPTRVDITVSFVKDMYVLGLVVNGIYERMATEGRTERTNGIRRANGIVDGGAAKSEVVYGV